MRDSKKLVVAVSIALGLGASATIARAQQTPAPLVVKPLSGGVYWTQGGSAGANTGFIVGDIRRHRDRRQDDAGFGDGRARRDRQNHAEAGVTHVILTHSDGDHVNGLAGFPKGLTIIAHENDKKEMEAALKGGEVSAAPRLPTIS